MKRFLLVILLIAGSAQAKPPACAHWPTDMALATLKNAGVTDPKSIIHDSIKAILLAAEPVGRGVYKEVYDITYRERNGRIIEVVTLNNASDEECSLSNVDVLIVSKHLGR